MDRKSNGKEKINWATKTFPLPLDPGDIICPQCKGEGYVDTTSDSDDWDVQCNKCWGVGKLDWIERIMGKANPNPCRTLKASWTIETQDDLTAIYSIDSEKELIDTLASELSNKIDEEIVGKIVNLSVTKSKLK